jgi:hypothetical protein
MKKQKNILAARVEPWQLFKFKKFVEWRNSRAGIILQEALQIYFSTMDLPKDIMDHWLDEYHQKKED